MTSLALVARPRLPLDHLETASLIRINCRCEEFFNTGSVGGGEGEEVCLTESEVVRFWSRIKETNRTKN